VAVKAQRDVRIHAGAVDDFALDEFRIVEVDTGSIGVVRTAEGFFAVRNKCPHMGAEICASRATRTMLPSRPFEYAVDDAHTVVRCPWHRWEFHMDTGESVGQVTGKRLVTYDVIIEGQEVYVQRRAKQRAGAGAARNGAGAKGGNEG
jgi:nitrite reductase (NADH) small subunit